MDTVPTQPDRLAALLEAAQQAHRRRDWLATAEQLTEAAAIARNRRRFDRRAS